MRGDAAVTLRLLLRGPGIAGLAAGIGGVAAIVAVLLPWHEVVASVELLGTTSAGTEARILPVPRWWWGWCGLLAGVVAVWLGLDVALDRAVRWARAGLVAAAAAMVVSAGAALLAPPELHAFPEAAASLERTADRLPTGVELSVAVRASVGPWITLVASALVVVGAVGSRET